MQKANAFLAYVERRGDEFLFTKSIKTVRLFFENSTSVEDKSWSFLTLDTFQYFEALNSDLGLNSKGMLCQ